MIRRFAVVVPILLAAACAVNPATGKRELSLVSEGQEIQMGLQYDQQLVQELGEYPDTALAKYVDGLGRQLAALSERPGLPWTFRVMDDPTVNAFAVPGGHVYITRGILAHMNSEAQLVSVLGHEIGHITARHTVQQMTQQTLFQAGLIAGVILKPELADYAGLAGAALQVLFLKFSRDDEAQADELGFRYMRRANYDPREMAEMFAELSRVSAAAGARLPEWQSTHPDPVGRKEKTLERAATVPEQELSAAIVRREEYLRRLDAVMYGPNPREGFFRESRFLHPDLQFEFTFPTGWKTVNEKTVVGAVGPNQEVVLMIGAGQGTSPADGARTFFAQQGVSGSPSSTTVNGLPAAGGGFVAETQNGVLQGRVLFIRHRDVLFRVMGYAAQARWGAYQNSVGASLPTFRPLTDATALAVQPWRIDVVRVDRTMTPTEFAQRYPGPVSADELALINQIDAGGRFMNRNLAKRVVGQAIR